MRGRIQIAILALVAFCASFGAPLQPLFAGSMSCCPTGKSSACCKRKSGAGWIGNASCGTTCACAFPTTGAPLTTSAAIALDGPAFTAAVTPAPVSADATSSYQAFLFQRPPPARA